MTFIMSSVVLENIHNVVAENAMQIIPRRDKNNLFMIANKPYLKPYGQNLYNTYYKQAACLLQDIVRLHPFVDGNKRTALLTAFTYLQANDIPVQMPKDADKVMLDIAKKPDEDQLERIAEWLQNQVHDWKVN